MKANELRIGNWVHNTNKDVRVKSLSDDSFMSIVTEPNLIGATHGGDIHPIPLTEEWLVKFGWDNGMITKGFNRVYVKLNCTVSTPSGDEFIYGIYVCKKRNGVGDLITQVKYVHSLQNIYFSLTGEELSYSM